MIWETARHFNSWPGQISNLEAKQEVGRKVAGFVDNGHVIGFGSGSTAYVAIQAIARRIADEDLQVRAICTSAEVSLACAAWGIPTTTLLQNRPDWAFDGADEVDDGKNLIKGRGGAMFLEKILITAAPKTYILVDDSKLVARLGAKFPIPVEVFPMALHVVEGGLQKLGANEISLRLAVKKDGPVITESGNFILDVRFDDIYATLERDIKAITGVVESGLFQGHRVEVLSARTGG